MRALCFLLVLHGLKNELLHKYSAMKHALRLFAFLLFFCLMNLAVKAQQKHFIYVESEDTRAIIRMTVSGNCTPFWRENAEILELWGHVRLPRPDRFRYEM